MASVARGQTAKWYTPSGRSIQRERKFVDGQFVEDTIRDTLETDASKKSRPLFKSDAGRPVYGGGGVTPDVIVQDDTLTTAEQQLFKALSPKFPDFSTALQEDSGSDGGDHTSKLEELAHDLLLPSRPKCSFACLRPVR